MATLFCAPPSSFSARLSRNSRQFIQLSPSLCCLSVLPLHISCSSLASILGIRMPVSGSFFLLLAWLRSTRASGFLGLFGSFILRRSRNFIRALCNCDLLFPIEQPTIVAISLCS